MTSWWIKVVHMTWPRTRTLTLTQALESNVIHEHPTHLFFSRLPACLHAATLRLQTLRGFQNVEGRSSRGSGSSSAAADELDNGQHDSLQKAAAAHNVPEATLRHRRKGRHTKKDAHADQQALPPVAETALVERIRHCGYSGFLLMPALIREYANDAIHAIPGRLDPVNVSASWLQAFLVRHPLIRSHWLRYLDNARFMGATEEVVRHWFVGLGEVMCDFHVVLTNIFNMDKTGFMFSQGASKHVVVASGDPASRFKAQPGTRESATFIKCIGSGRQVLPPLIITKGKRHTVGEQQRMQGIPATWCFSKSDTSWTNNKLTIEWLENVFELNTRLSLPSEWHLLIIDGHRSHTSKAFCNVLWSHQIVPYLLPAHATHIMQPLDVSIFSPLMAAYCRIVNTATGHMDTVDKVQFRTFYAQAREKVLTQSAARKAFSDSGISLDPSPEKRKTAATVGRKVATGDQRVLSKDVMITREFAECELVAKGPAKSRRTRGNCQEEEEEVAAPPPAAALDGDDASEDGDEALLASPSTPSPPPTHSLLDELDDGEPLSAVDDDDPGGFGFFDTLPQAGPSRMEH
ncbi:related to transposase [Sporisorium reilianum f. sp. reilianum]|uniref:Related to transposase n=1 Tax=Sporisorium reilianum f. sp. reilianum TaxID=72559 RepID=A0A2N8UM72_9BASI|nr:related to transposase [Sporisorium reilianum f. sp. reilianum]